MSEPKYKRVLLKLSGEVLAGEQKTGVNAEIVGKICDKIKEVVEMGVQVQISYLCMQWDLMFLEL